MDQRAKTRARAASPESASRPSQPIGVVFDVKRYAIHDGPGIRTTVFFKGCPLRCRWCHNPESWDQGPEHSLRTSLCTGCGRCVEACEQGAISRRDGRLWTDTTGCVFCGACVAACPGGAREILGRQVTVGELMAKIDRDVLFYDESGGGVTFSGGEPLMQAEFLERLLAECKARAIHTALDTSCYAPWQVVEKISRLVDLWLCDLKHMDSEAHERLTGVSNELVLDNLRRLARGNRQIILRLPIIPGVNDDDRNITRSAEFVASLDGPGRVDILPYNELLKGKLARLTGDYKLLAVEPPGRERVRAIGRKLEALGLAVKIGG